MEAAKSTDSAVEGRAVQGLGGIYMTIIDLHMHTKYSDGNHMVSEVLQIAEELRKSINLQIISITDHDSVLAYQELKNKEIREIYKGKIIYGTELSFNLDNKLYDVLGYNIDTDKMLEILAERANTARRIEIQNSLLTEFISVCDRKGIKHSANLRIITGNNNEAFNVVYNDISNFALHPKNESFREYIDKSNIAVFYKKCFTNPKSDFFVNDSRYSPTLKEAIAMIHQCGGKAFLAHSFAYGLDNTEIFIEYAISQRN